MSDNGFYGFLWALLTVAVLALARRVDFPPAAVVALVWVGVAAVAVALVALRWAAERELAQPVAHPIC